MKHGFSKSFFKSLRKLNNKQLNKEVAGVVLQIEKANTLSEISSLIKLKGFDEYFRIRVGNYRIGAKLMGDTLWLTVIDDRKNIYKHFP